MDVITVSQMCTVNWRCLYLLFFSLLLSVKTHTHIYAIGKFQNWICRDCNAEGKCTHCLRLLVPSLLSQSSSQICGIYSFSLMARFVVSIVLRRLCDLSGGWLIRTTCLQFVWNFRYRNVSTDFCQIFFRSDTMFGVERAFQDRSSIGSRWWTFKVKDHM